MKALLWKDYRINRMILVMGLALFVGPYVVLFAASWREHWPTLPPVSHWPYGLLPASLVSVGLSLLTLVTLAGNSIASERADRSAEFLAYLPPARARILASKLILALAPVGVVWAVNLILAWFLIPAVGPAPGGVGEVRETVVGIAAAAVLLFGAAFLGSAILDSPAMATSLGIGAALCVIFTFAMIGAMAGWSPEQLKVRANITAVSLGMICFIMAVAHYLRRVEP
jgi:hypothetical protein